MAGILDALAVLAAPAPPANEIEALKAKIAARDGKPGFKANVEELRARLAELEAANGS